MIRLGVILCVLVLLSGCKAERTQAKSLQLKYLDEYILPNDISIDATLVGGLSGIDYHDGSYYIVCDDNKNPRFYKATIEINNFKFDSISIDEVVEISDYPKELDLESIRMDTLKNQLVLVSEGSIRKKKDPSLLSVNQDGKFIKDFEIPAYFKVQGSQQPRHNGVFEGLSLSYDKKGYWVATELPLKDDGPKPKFKETTSPIRITYFDSIGTATKQFAYLLDRVAKKPLNDFGVNGVTDILAYAPTKLLVIERSYSTGYGNQGNVVKLYSVDFANANNTLRNDRLTRTNYYPIKKELVFNFEEIRDQLTNASIDNLEGICFGPILPNGNRSLIVISDNNFSEDEQQNQFILMELID